MTLSAVASACIGLGALQGASAMDTDELVIPNPSAKWQPDDSNDFGEVDLAIDNKGFGRACENAQKKAKKQQLQEPSLLPDNGTDVTVSALKADDLGSLYSCFQQWYAHAFAGDHNKTKDSVLQTDAKTFIAYLRDIRKEPPLGKAFDDYKKDATTFIAYLNRIGSLQDAIKALKNHLAKKPLKDQVQGIDSTEKAIAILNGGTEANGKGLSVEVINKLKSNSTNGGFHYVLTEKLLGLDASESQAQWFQKALQDERTTGKV